MRDQLRIATAEGARYFGTMKFSLALCALAMLAVPSAHAAEEAPAPQKKPGLIHRLLHPFGGGGTEKKNKEKSGKLTVDMKLAPLPLKLSAANRLKVTLTLMNHSKKLAQLEFPTSQRIEVLVKNSAGKMVEQWSQDQSFASEPTVVAINPGERAEYAVEVATRDLAAGQTYTVLAFFPNHESLKVEKTIVPEK